MGDLIDHLLDCPGLSVHVNQVDQELLSLRYPLIYNLDLVVYCPPSIHLYKYRALMDTDKLSINRDPGLFNTSSYLGIYPFSLATPQQTGASLRN